MEFKKKEKKVLIAFRLPIEKKKQLEELAEKLNTTYTTIIQTVIEEWLKKQKK